MEQIKFGKKTISFGKIAYSGGKKLNEVTLDVELRPDSNGRAEFSVCGKVWNPSHTDIIAGGQCLDELYEFFRNNDMFREIHGLWKNNHLNGMHAGTPDQERCLEDAGEDVRENVRNELRSNAWNRAKTEYGYDEIFYPTWCTWNSDKWSRFDIDCEILKRNGLYEVPVDGKPYRYGSGWLYREIPEEDLEKIQKYVA